MPIVNETVTRDQFDFLQNNISQQSEQFTTASVLAQSGLEYVVLLQTIAPEVDMVNPFASHLINLESFDSSSNFTSVVATLNNHVIFRGTTLQAGDTLSDRLNRWLDDPGDSLGPVLVTRTYANLSSGAGYIIDEANIEP